LKDQTPYLPIVKESANALQGNLVGTGPFQLADGTGTGKIVLEPNPFYGEPQAFPVQQIELRKIGYEALSLEQLMEADIDLQFGGTPSPLAIPELAPSAAEYLRQYSDGCPGCQPNPGGRRPRPPRPPKLELLPIPSPIRAS
jgi:ABC-type transport system substrate-binding protein